MILTSEMVIRMLTTRQLFLLIGSTIQDRIESAPVQQPRISLFVLLTTAFLPLNFCTSVFYLLSPI